MRRKFFVREEFACKCGCGFAAVDTELEAILISLRSHYDQPITLTSANRCEGHNKKVGGAPRSYHLKGMAADIVVANIDPHVVYSFLCQAYPGQYGLGDARNFTHIDVRTKKTRWTY